MRAGILAVGTELLGTDRLDSNSLLLTAALERFGVELHRKTVVGDVEELISSELLHMLAEVDLVLVTGGLGPTADDVTREAIALALGRRVISDADLLAELQAKFARYRVPMPEVNVKQAELIEGATPLSNPRGTAPGMLMVHEGKTIFLFPGVPFELEGLIASELEPWLQQHHRNTVFEVQTLRVSCLTEAALEERILPAYQEFGRHAITVLAGPGDLRVRLAARGTESERREQLLTMSSRLGELIGPALYSLSEDKTLESVVGELLAQQGRTVATAESCTGGLVAERLTRVAGSSSYFLGAIVAYSDLQKERLLMVPSETLTRYGAVSRNVVEAMAVGVIGSMGSDLGIGVSGIAGPTGGTAEKPVGTVHLAVAEKEGGIFHRMLLLPGDRSRVRWLSSQWALELLRQRLLESATKVTPSAHSAGEPRQ